jgi:hypothetical protein
MLRVRVIQPRQNLSVQALSELAARFGLGEPNNCDFDSHDPGTPSGLGSERTLVSGKVSSDGAIDSDYHWT